MKIRGFYSLLLSISIFLSSVLCFTSCTEKKEVYALMVDFCSSYGISDTIFSPSVDEGERGYTDAVFFEYVFLEKSDAVSDYAVVFSSELNRAEECAIFLCFSEYDALVACELLRKRVDLIKAMGVNIDTSNASDAVVFKSGRYAVMCVLPDNERAEKLWRKIL